MWESFVEIVALSLVVFCIKKQHFGKFVHVATGLYEVPWPDKIAMFTFRLLNNPVLKVVIKKFILVNHHVNSFVFEPL